MSAKIEVNSIPKEIDEILKNLIECLESAIEYCEEVRGGTIEQDRNLYYLIHDWGRRANHEHNDELAYWIDKLAEFYNGKFADTRDFRPL